MHPVHHTRWPLALLAVTTAFAMHCGPLQAQQAQQPQQIHPGNEATGAVGSQVQPMKPDCPPKTATGEKQAQHPPTAGLSEKVPTMTAENKCPDANSQNDPQTQKN